VKEVRLGKSKTGRKSDWRKSDWKGSKKGEEVTLGRKSESAKKRAERNL
jgi:hypothetical protein